MEALQGHTSWECQDHASCASSILLHNHNDFMLGSASNLLNSTRPNHGHKDHQLFQTPTSFTPNHPHRLLDLSSPILRPCHRSLHSKIHWHSHRNHSSPTYRGRPHPLFDLHGLGCNLRSEKKRSGSRQEHAWCNPSGSTIAHFHVLAIFPVLHIWDCRHVYVRGTARVFLLRGT